MRELKAFWNTLLHAGRNLLPIVLVVAAFQLFILQSVPEGLAGILIGLGIVVVGVALFLQGLEMGIFPIGKSLSNAFARRGSLPLLLAFGFAFGFAAVIAEPALIAVAEQAQTISQGHIDALTLRLIIATSVGLVVAVGVLRTLLGLPLHWFMIGGYIAVVTVTWFAPAEIVGLAYDSGGVTTNIVTVPLIAALGMGLAASISGRNVLSDGFGLVALAVMVPMITVQAYGIYVFEIVGVDPGSDSLDIAAPAGDPSADLDPAGILTGLLITIRDVLPIIAAVLFFQLVILRQRIPHLKRVVIGFLLVILGLYAFVVGLKLGLFPIGERMADQLIARDNVIFLYLFAFAIGFATTMAEPALIAIGDQAEHAAQGQIRASVIRLLVAMGVAIGITIGVHRILAGDSIHYYVIGGYALVILLTLLAPRYIIALAYDLGGVTTSEVTVPLVTALGIGLATQIEGRDALMDGFGLIAFASIFPIVTVLGYATIAELANRWRASRPSRRPPNDTST
ncbi:DUF1538 domain-containing protein [Guyparkeria halophila]|uniref:DUF1538 domain-containing protein n=1 Tax=Guyparkeria halophila TaxID=47960 RepID=A0ABZ0YUK7_9GAMM|nr:DUF1538 domain-containing protein [Guyparkeria halophila]WQH15855.1 DUF1538 domain-containing protein [Guyparkeria halophila]